jgi:hypothetical protein
LRRCAATVKGKYHGYPCVGSKLEQQMVLKPLIKKGNIHHGTPLAKELSRV